MVNSMVKLSDETKTKMQQVEDRNLIPKNLLKSAKI
jgi:hypothetical protein